MANLNDEIRFFVEKEAEFERDHYGEWVVISHQQVQGFFEDFQVAAKTVMTKFKNETVLLRQIGIEPESYPDVKFATT